MCHGVLKGRERRSGCCGDCHSRRDIRLISCVWPLPGAEWALVACPSAPRQYDRAMEVAVAAHCGVLEIGPSMAAQGAMPWSLKEAFLSGQTAVLFSCLVTNSPQFLNESHLCIHGIFIAGADGRAHSPCSSLYQGTMMGGPTVHVVHCTRGL